MTEISANQRAESSLIFSKFKFWDREHSNFRSYDPDNDTDDESERKTQGKVFIISKNWLLKNADKPQNVVNSKIFLYLNKK